MSSVILPPMTPAVLPPPAGPISVAQYHAMIEAGYFNDDDRFELLEGSVVPKMSKNPRHPYATTKTRKNLEKLVPSGWYVRVQDPITTLESEPEPDVSVVRGSEDDYPDRHPSPADTGLIVEVAESSLARDRSIKKRIYARAKVPVYWIVNLVDRCVEVYTNPSGPTENPDYEPPQVYGETDHEPVVLDGREIGQIEVRAILP